MLITCLCLLSLLLLIVYIKLKSKTSSVKSQIKHLLNERDFEDIKESLEGSLDNGRIRIATLKKFERLSTVLSINKHCFPSILSIRLLRIINNIDKILLMFQNENWIRYAAWYQPSLSLEKWDLNTQKRNKKREEIREALSIVRSIESDYFFITSFFSFL